MNTETANFIESSRQLFNQLVIFCTEVERVIGCSETDEDFYYITLNSCGERNRISAVFEPIQLKGFIPNQSYETLDRIFTLNHAGEVSEFIINISN